MCERLSSELENRALELMGSFRNHLTRLIGTPKIDYSIANFFQSDEGPTFQIRDKDVDVILGPNAALYEPTFLANLAHEAAHIHLTEGIAGWPSGMEEGFALEFELSRVEFNYGKSERSHFENHLPQSYKISLQDFNFLKNEYADPAKIALKKFYRLTGPKTTQFKSMFPRATWFMCYRLARRKRMR